MPETEAEAEPSAVIRTVTPLTPTKTSLGNKLLDAIIGIGAMVLLLPLAPFIVLLYLWDRFARKSAESDD